MTNCIGAPARQWLEQYVERTLPEDEAQKFEDHYFDCPVCLGELQAVQSAQEALRRHPIPVTRHKRVLAWPTTWPAIVSVGALAATLVLGLITFRMAGHSPQPAGDASVTAPATAPAPQATQNPAQPNAAPVQPTVQIAELADLRLPTFHAPVLRGEEEDTAFERGMKQYVAGDCTGAAKTLAQVEPDGPDGMAARFYTAVCRMHAGDLTGAASALRHVASAGDSPYQESAFYYLAQIALAQSDAAEARRDLNDVVSLRGDLEHQARRQLTQISPTSGK
jgi:Putative zinc-finger/Tetratricopeptide repeat